LSAAKAEMKTEWKNLSGEYHQRVEDGIHCWTIAQEFGGSGTVSIKLSSSPSSPASDVLMDTGFEARRETPWKELPSLLGSHEMGHAHGMVLAKKVVAMLAKQNGFVDDGADISQLWLDQGWRFDGKNINRDYCVSVYRRKFLKTRNYFSLFVNSKRDDQPHIGRSYDLDYQTAGSNSWYNVLRLNEMEFPDIPAGHPAQAVADAYRPARLSPLGAAEIVALVIADTEQNGPPKRSKRII
jgi:hypothetical protein